MIEDDDNDVEYIPDLNDTDDEDVDIRREICQPRFSWRELGIGYGQRGIPTVD